MEKLSKEMKALLDRAVVDIISTKVDSIVKSRVKELTGEFITAIDKEVRAYIKREIPNAVGGYVDDTLYGVVADVVDKNYKSISDVIGGTIKKAFKS